jgi:sigma-54-interacting transcriptional regulator
MGGVSVEYQARLCSGNSNTAPYSSRPFSGADSAPLSAAKDLKMAQATHTNVLVVGPNPIVKNVLGLVAPDARRDTAVQCQGGRLQLPQVSSRPTVLVVHDVDALTAAEQRTLLDWLEAASTRTQVVSTASVPLLPLVQTHAFNDTLYYRLNTIYIDLFE